MDNHFMQVDTVDRRSTRDASIFTRFSENYRYISEVSESLCMRNISRGISDNAVGVVTVHADNELFLINNTQGVEYYYPDAASPTGYSRTQFPFKASFIEVFVTQEGRVVLLYAFQGELFFVMEESSLSYTFGSPVRVEAGGNAQNRITGLYVTDFGNDKYIGITKIDTRCAEYPRLLFGIWNENGFELGNSTDWKDFEYPEQGMYAWYSRENALYFVKAASRFAVPVVADDNELVLDPFPLGLKTCRDFCVVKNPATLRDHLVCVLEDNNIYMESKGGRWFAVSEKGVFTHVWSCLDNRLDKDPVIHLFAVSSVDDLYHGCIADYGVTPIQLVPIFSGATDIAEAVDNTASMTVFLKGAHGHSLEMLNYGYDTDLWNNQLLEYPNFTGVEPFSSYVSEITMKDSYGAAIPSLRIRLGATEKTKVYVNNKVEVIGPHSPVELFTDALGAVHIAQEVDSLSIPELFIEYADPSDPNKKYANSVLAVAQYKVLEEKFATLSAEDLAEARLADGSYLLEEKYRSDTETLTSLSDAVRECISWVDEKKAVPVKADFITGNWVLRNAVMSAHMLPDREQFQSWSLTLHQGKLKFQRHDHATALELIAREHAVHKKSLWSRIGDFFRAVGAKFVDVVKFIFTKTAQGIKAVITLVVDGITRVFETILDCARHVYETIQVIFSQVKVFFSKIYEWLAFIFNWGDILRTKEILCHTNLAAMDSIKRSLSDLEALSEKGIDFAKDKVTEIFAALVGAVEDNTSIIDFFKGNVRDLPEGKPIEAMSNNLLLNKFRQNADEATYPSREHGLSLATFDSGKFDKFLAILTEYASDIMNTTAFAEAMAYFTTSVTGVDAFLLNTLKGFLKIMEGLAQVVLSTVSLLVKAFFAIAEYILDLLRDLMTCEIKIPFLSQLYRKIANAPLSLLDCIALIAAVPATTIYKIASGKAPFVDEAAVEVFKKAIDDKLDFSFVRSTVEGGAPQVRRRRAGNQDDEASDDFFTKIFTVFDGVYGGVYYVGATICDGWNGFGNGGSGINKTLLVGTIIMETGWAYTSLVLMIDDLSGISQYFGSVEGGAYLAFSITTWLFCSFIGLVLDVVSCFMFGKLSDAGEETMVILTAMLCGFISLATAVGAEIMYTMLRKNHDDIKNESAAQQTLGWIASLTAPFVSATKLCWLAPMPMRLVSGGIATVISGLSALLYPAVTITGAFLPAPEGNVPGQALLTENR